MGCGASSAKYAAQEPSTDKGAAAGQAGKANDESTVPAEEPRGATAEADRGQAEEPARPQEAPRAEEPPDIRESSKAAVLREDFQLAPQGSKVDSAVEVPDAVERGVTWRQLRDLRELVEEECASSRFVDAATSKFSFSGREMVENPNLGKPLRFGKWPASDKDDAASFAEATMQDVVDLFIKPLTQGPGSQGRFLEGCSYMETVADGPQLPQLYVSHFWGEPLWGFCEAVKTYVQKQSLSDRTCLWLHALATRLWSPRGEPSPDSLADDGMRALKAATTSTTVLLTDLATCPLATRDWCLFEMDAAAAKEGHSLDFVFYGPGKPGAESNRASSMSRVNSDAGSGGARIVCTSSGDATRGREHQSHLAGLRGALELLFAGPRGASEDAWGAGRRTVAAPLLFHRALDGDAAGVSELLAVQPDMGYFTPNGTALHAAVNKARGEVAKLLLKAGASVNSQGTDRLETPLHRAANFDRGEMAEMLIEAKADLSLQTKIGMTALDVAKKEKSFQVVKLLEAAAPQEGSAEEAQPG